MEHPTRFPLSISAGILRVPVMTISPDPRNNHLLGALPETELQHWLPHLEYVELRLDEVLAPIVLVPPSWRTAVAIGSPCTAGAGCSGSR
jgi:hypothetical protein